MKKLLPIALAAVLLAGCGTANTLTGARATKGSVSAQSLTGVTKGVRGMFKAVFIGCDADKNGYLSVQEMPVQVPAIAPGEPAPDLTPAKQAMMEKLDLNKNGRVTYNEFAAKANVDQVVVEYRHEVGRLFANLDMNGDRLLMGPELEGRAPVSFEEADLNHNGKVTLSELEDAMAAKMSNGGSVTPPAPPEPQPAPSDAPPADNPDTPPAPPADTPSDN